MNFELSKALRPLAIFICAALVLACAEQENLEKPAPASLTREDTGYFCGMIVDDHQGPKSQIYTAGQNKPIWFTTVRDGIAFTLLPEETGIVSAFYVTAMDNGEWQHPEARPSNWIEADQAWYVVQSSKLGSMGAAETIPFIDQQAAEEFTSEFGGVVLRLNDISQHYVLGPASR